MTVIIPISKICTLVIVIRVSGVSVLGKQMCLFMVSIFPQIPVFVEIFLKLL